MFGLFGKKRLAGVAVSPRDLGLVIDARVAVSRELHLAALADENVQVAAIHPGATVATQFILTDAVWNGPHSSHLLGALMLSPFDDWNVRYLPADDASAALLGLPKAWRVQFDEILRVADSLIAQIFEAEGLPADPIDALGAPEAVKHAVRANLAGLANYFYEDHILPALRNAD